MSLSISADLLSLYTQWPLANRPEVSRVLPPAKPSDRRIDPTFDSSVVVSIGNFLNVPTGGLGSAASSANDGISLLQTADSALRSVKSNLMRIRDLAVQARGTDSQYRRDTLQDAMAPLVADVDRIGSRTEFKGIRVFDPSPSIMVGDPGLSAVLKGLKGGWLENAEKMIQKYYGLTADGAPLDIELNTFTDGPYGVIASVTATVPSYGAGKGGNLILEIDRANFVPPNLPDGGIAPLYNDRIIAHEMTHAVMARTMNYADLVRNAGWFVEGTAEFIHGADERLDYDLASVNDNAQSIVDALDDGLLAASIDYSASYAAVRYLHAQIKAAGGEGIKDLMDYLSANPRATLDDAFRNAVSPLGGPASAYTSAKAFLRDFDSHGAAFITANLKLANADTGAIGGLDADGGPMRTAESVVSDIGMRPDRNVLLGFTEHFASIPAEPTTGTRSPYQQDSAAASRRGVAGAMNASALGIRALNLVDAPDDALGQVDRALSYVNGESARISAELQRLDSTYSRLQNIFSSLGGGPSGMLGGYSGDQLAALLGSTIIKRPEAALSAQANIDRRMARHLLA